MLDYDSIRPGTGLNDNGQLAFRAQFTDGSSGIFIANLGTPAAIPEPAGLGVLFVLGLTFRRLERPRRES